MQQSSIHSFHIPVMGLSFTIDTPLKVARFGISSVISIVVDELLEDMRRFYSAQHHLPYAAITEHEADYRARRITAYLDLVHDIVNAQMDDLRKQPFEPGTEITKYFELLPASPLKDLYRQMCLTSETVERAQLEAKLRRSLEAGAIDVNIMAKVDKDNYAKDGSLLPPEYSDATSALRGFANSRLSSSVVISAGYNPRLYNYLEQYSCFYPDASGKLPKRVILKVSDYRSALIQGKILAKKGVWVSEFRIESGLNCGGHAFPTEGILQGPILEEFKQKRLQLKTELFNLCNDALQRKGLAAFKEVPQQRITAQGGVGTSAEHQLLLQHYGLDSVGWGSPFLLVPEATGVDPHTLNQLATASPDDYYLSHASPLGVPFNNFRRSTSESQRIKRIEKGRPGSPCYKKYLSSNTEFTEQPICTASRQYQHLKIAELKASNLPEESFREAVEKVTEKDCLCEGLSVSAHLSHDLPVQHKLTAVTICPGPNLAFFSGTFSLKEMIDHIYGRGFVGNGLSRPHVFINELNLYIKYYRKEFGKELDTLSEKLQRSKVQFKNNLLAGIAYYKGLLPVLATNGEGLTMLQQLQQAETTL
jgi:hypothetical protein